ILDLFTRFVLTPILGFWVFLSVVRIGMRGTSSQSINQNQIFSETKKRFFPVLFVTILSGFMIVLAQIITFGPASLLFGLGTWMHSAVLIGVGDVLFVFAAFGSLFLTCRWMLFYFMAPYVCAMDDVTKKEALVTSRQLVKTRFWSVLIRIVLPKFIFILFGLGFISMVTFTLQIFINGSPDMNVNEIIRLTTFTSRALTVIVAIFLNPLLILSDVILYKNLSDTAEKS
ncbi:MAG: hypothetical protein AAB664_01210, partial [Patescibacteria group bacterium]